MIRSYLQVGSSSNRYALRLPQPETKSSIKQLAPTDPILGPENLLTGFAQKGLPSICWPIDEDFNWFVMQVLMTRWDIPPVSLGKSSVIVAGVFGLGSGPVFLFCFAVFSRWRSQIWPGDLRVVFWFLCFLLLCFPICHLADETTVFHAEFLIRLSAYPNVRTEPQSDIGNNRGKKKVSVFSADSLRGNNIFNSMYTAVLRPSLRLVAVEWLLPPFVVVLFVCCCLIISDRGVCISGSCVRDMEEQQGAVKCWNTFVRWRRYGCDCGQHIVSCRMMPSDLNSLQLLKFLV